MSTNPSIASLTAEDGAAFRQFWEAYDKHYDEVTRVVGQAALQDPEFGPFVQAAAATATPDQAERSREQMRRALLDNEWTPVLEALGEQGIIFAQANVSIYAWFGLLNSWRPYFVEKLIQDYRDPDQLKAALNGMNKLLELTMAEVSNAYLRAKEETINKQRSAILELSTPVLPLRDGLLLLPIIGVLDTHRARQLTQVLLHAIRDHRAKIAVMDVTGVPVVDSRVANHLIQTVEAARLMGTHVILTGLSPDVAQTLVTVGVNLTGIDTRSDVQSGVEEANRRLRMKIVKLPDDTYRGNQGE